MQQDIVFILCLDIWWLYEDLTGEERYTKNKYCLKNKKSFWGEIKSIFPFLKELSIDQIKLMFWYSSCNL